MPTTHKIVYELLTFVIGRCNLEETYMTQYLLATVVPIAKTHFYCVRTSTYGWNRPEKSKSLPSGVLRV